MFDSCHFLENLLIPNLDTSKVVNMENLFSNCKAIKTLDLSHLKFDKLKNIEYMFYGCSSLELIIFPINFNSSNVFKEFAYDGCDADIIRK